jgi:hypothetical protein
MVPADQLEKWNEEMKLRGVHNPRSMTAAVNMAALFAKRAIRPDEVAALRRDMFDVVKKNMGTVEQVLEGKKTWSPTQVRLFSLLTERVMPKLSSITVDDTSTKRLEDMSIEELEMIALGKKKATAVDAVIKTGEVLDEVAEKRERREAKAQVLSELAHVTSIDDAEKAYIAEKAAISSRELAAQDSRQFSKYQPPTSPEEVGRRRATAFGAKISVKDRWREKGFTEEEIEAKEAERMANWRDSNARRQKALQERIARNGGLSDGAKLPSQIDSIRRKTLREFRVDPARGVRDQAAVLKERNKEEADLAKRLEKRNNPRVYRGRLFPANEGDPKVLTLQQLRVERPDLFVGENPKAELMPVMPEKTEKTDE